MDFEIKNEDWKLNRNGNFEIKSFKLNKILKYKNKSVNLKRDNYITHIFFNLNIKPNMERDFLINLKLY